MSRRDVLDAVHPKVQVGLDIEDGNTAPEHAQEFARTGREGDSSGPRTRRRRVRRARRHRLPSAMPFLQRLGHAVEDEPEHAVDIGLWERFPSIYQMAL